MANISCCKCGKHMGEIRDATLRKGWAIVCAMCMPHKSGSAHKPVESEVVNDLMSILNGNKR